MVESLINGELNPHLACQIGKHKFRNYMVLGQFNISWLSKVYMATGCWNELLILCFFVGFSYGFWRRLDRNNHGPCKENGCAVFAIFSLVPPPPPTRDGTNWVEHGRHIRLFVPPSKMHSPWVDIVSQLYEASLANVYKHLSSVLLFHIIVIKKNILNSRITLDSSLEMNVTIKVNIRKRWSHGSCEWPGKIRFFLRVSIYASSQTHRHLLFPPSMFPQNNGKLISDIKYFLLGFA